ncbi:ribonucleoside hydrolase RihC [Lactobacillus selangorensis]|nr:nucleoside hydrolase [Lactobacillus selangorensis]KRN28366.1 ribonucleoside hydrolase RihC [Lactobacillus selangorensis]
MDEPIIFDSDPGIGGILATSTALTDPRIDLKLLTTVTADGQIAKATQHSLNLVAFYQRNVPVAGGAAHALIKPYEPQSDVYNNDGTADYEYPDYETAPLPEAAADAMYAALCRSPKPMTLVVTGPYTNLALLLLNHPDCKNKIKRLILLGGALSRGNVNSLADYNVFTDPEAAVAVYQSGLPITMVSLDVNLNALITDDTINQLKQIGPLAESFQALYKKYLRDIPGGVPAYDMHAFAYLLHPEFYTTKKYWIDVQTDGPASGVTVADIRGAYHNGQTNATVCTGVDAKAFNAWFLREVSVIQDIFIH